MGRVKKYDSTEKSLEVEVSELKSELEEIKMQLKEEQEKRQFYQLISDFTFGWELWFDPEENIKYCSPSCFDVTGFSANQILSAKSIADLIVYSPDKEKYNNFLHNSIAQILVGKFLEFRILTRSKQLRWCTISVRGVYNLQGKYLGIRASIQDITQLKRAMGHIKKMETAQKFENKTTQRLQTQLGAKDRELVSFLIQLSQKNELLKKVSNSLKTIDLENLKSAKEVVGQLTETLSGRNIAAYDWELLEVQVEKIHPGFLDKLQNRHPVISVKDRRLCVYLRLGLSSREISGLQNITPRSVEIARVRLRKKLKLQTSVRLAKYLIAL